VGFYHSQSHESTCAYDMTSLGKWAGAHEAEGGVSIEAAFAEYDRYVWELVCNRCSPLAPDVAFASRNYRN